MEPFVDRSELQEKKSQKIQSWFIACAVVIVCVVFGSGFLAGVFFEKSTKISSHEAAADQQNVSDELTATSTSTDSVVPVVSNTPAQGQVAQPNQSDGNSNHLNKAAEYALVCIGMSNAHQECDDWLVKINGPLQDVINPKLKVINCAVGSHAIERWNDDSYNNVLWDACVQRVHDAGLAVEDVKYVWHKAMVQYVRDEQNNLLPSHPASNSAYNKLSNELDIFATRLSLFLPAVETVFVSGRSYGGFSTRPDRGEPLAKLSNQVVAEWLEDNQNVAGIAYIQGPYLWAPNCTERVGEGLCYQQDDFQRDGIHPGQGALNKITRLLHDYFSQYDWYLR